MTVFESSRRLAAAFALLLAHGCTAPEKSPAPEFRDVAADVGLSFRGSTYGAALVDLDDDGFEDVYLSAHGKGPEVFLNQEGARFVALGGAERERMNLPTEGDQHGVGFADLDNDGDADFFQAVGGRRGTRRSPSDVHFLRYWAAASRRFEDRSPSVPHDPYGRSRGVTLVDLDNDGLLDLVIDNVGSPFHRKSKCRLYAQRPVGTFRDVTEEMGLEVTAEDTLWADLDADGFVDAVANGTIYWNEAGTRFAAASLSPGYSEYDRFARIVDFDNDGRLDLLIAHSPYVGPQDDFRVEGDRVLRLDFDQPDGPDRDAIAFRTGSEEIEIVFLTHRSSTAEEVEKELDHLRVFLGADRRHPPRYGYALEGFAVPRIEPGAPKIKEEGVYIYRESSGEWRVVALGNGRNPAEPGHFGITLRSAAPITGVRAEGLESGDFAADSIEIVLYRNGGRRRFAGEELDVGGDEAVSAIVTGFGGDLDNDAFTDFYLIGRSRLEDRPAEWVLMNESGRRLRAFRVPPTPGAEGATREAQLWDFDRDGRLDVLLTGNSGNATASLRQNRSANGHHWIELDLEGSGRTNRSALGTVVELYSAAGIQTRVVGRTDGTNTSLVPLHFGLGAEGKVDRIAVRWASGVQEIDGRLLRIDARNRIVEGRIESAAAPERAWGGATPPEQEAEGPWVAPGFSYDTVFEGPTVVGLAVHGDTIFAGDKQTGRIHRVRNGSLDPTPLVDLDVDNLNERGLLGLALHPDFPRSPYLYAYYSASADPGRDTSQKGVAIENRLVRLQLEGDRLGREQVLQRYEGSPIGFHNGGTLGFDAGGRLWVGLGDALRHRETPQSLAFPHGKLLRYTDAGAPAPENHFARDGDTRTLADIHSYGFRNPWTFAFHPRHGTVYVADQGNQIEDEIDVAVDGANYGWPEVEGPADGWRELEFARRTPAHRNPIWSSGSRTRCPAGLVVATGQLGLDRHLVWGECNRPWNVWAARLGGSTDQFLASDPFLLVRRMGRPVNMAWDSSGDLLVATMNADEGERGGKVRRLRLVGAAAARRALAPILSERPRRRAGEKPVEYGERIYSEVGCANCHSTDGTPLSGPTFLGLFGASRRLEGGREVLADEAYLRESIRDPQAKMVEGFAPVMPTYRGRFTEEEVTGLLLFMKSLRRTGPG